MPDSKHSRGARPPIRRKTKRRKNKLDDKLKARVQHLGFLVGTLPWDSDAKLEAHEEFAELVMKALSPKEQDALEDACYKGKADDREIVEHCLKAVGLPKPKWPRKVRSRPAS